jgi:hypothetical protein
MFSDVHNRIHFTIAAKVETRENHAKVDRDRKYVEHRLHQSNNFIPIKSEHRLHQSNNFIPIKSEHRLHQSNNFIPDVDGVHFLLV